jgi:hypothetical protein
MEIFAAILLFFAILFALSITSTTAVDWLFHGEVTWKSNMEVSIFIATIFTLIFALTLL